MPPKIRLMDGSMDSQLKLFGYESRSNSPHWTFPANKDEQLMKQVYLSFLNIGVDVITTNTYHFGSILDEKLCTTKDTRNLFETYFKTTCDLLSKLAETGYNAEVWGSVGTLATMYHDMSEYNGSYIDLPDSFTTAVSYFDTIIQIFNDKTNIKKLVFETISNEQEAMAALEALKKFPSMTAVFSFTCDKNACLRHGEKIEHIAKQLAANKQIVGIGLNCTDPDNINDALSAIKPFQFKEIFVYPNFGDDFFEFNQLETEENKFNLNTLSEWIANGATVIGGCCGMNEFQMRNLKKLIDEININAKN